MSPLLQTYYRITAVSSVDAVASIASVSIVIGGAVKRGQGRGDFSSEGMFVGEFMDLSLEKTRSPCSRLYNASI